MCIGTVSGMRSGTKFNGISSHRAHFQGGYHPILSQVSEKRDDKINIKSILFSKKSWVRPNMIT